MTTHYLSKDAGGPGISATREPVLRIAFGQGERITFETDDAAYAQLHEHHDMGKLTAPLNPVTGPVYVDGAEPGDVLAVTVHDITFPYGGWSLYLPGAGARSEERRVGKECRTRYSRSDVTTSRKNT